MCSLQRLKSVINSNLVIVILSPSYVHILHTCMYYINTVKFSLGSKQPSPFSKFNSRKIPKTLLVPDFNEIACVRSSSRIEHRSDLRRFLTSGNRAVCSGANKAWRIHNKTEREKTLRGETDMVDVRKEGTIFRMKEENGGRDEK